jgi:poly-gamma-glutamate capsule biosynthesis protein CapA/YwtB (metallophosphatase superfamily)
MKSETASIKVACCGDLLLCGESLNTSCSQALKDIKPLFEKADIVIGNLETPLTENGSSNPNKCSIRGLPAWAKVLKDNNVSVVSLANNHILDFGEQGLKDTLTILSQYGIVHVGAGMNEHDARAAKIIQCKEKKIGILARSSVEVMSRCYAKDDLPGAAFLDMDEVVAALQDLRQKTDYIIFLVHWGLEEYHYPMPLQRKQARQFIKAGAHAVIGHHPHVFQGIEKIENGVVLYSLGNFIIDDFSFRADYTGEGEREYYMTPSEKNRVGVIAGIILNENHASFEKRTYARNTHGENLSLLTGDRDDLRNLSYFLQIPCYSFLWRFYAVYKECSLRIFPNISLSKILRDFRKIRPGHFKQIFEKIMRSLKITFGKSTNPYD